MSFKNIFAVIAATIALTVTVSCTKEIEGVESADNHVYITRTFSSNIGTQDTKTSVDAEGTVSWSAGDVVRYYSVDNGTVGECTVAADGLTADLTMDVAQDASYLIAIHGGTALTKNSSTSVTVTGAIPAVQSGVFGDHHLTYTKITDLKSTTLRFSNLASYFKFTLNRTDVAKVVFSSNDETPLTGNGEVIIKFDTQAIPSYGSNQGSSITIDTKGAGTFYIATLPCRMAEGFTIDCYDAEGTYLGSAASTKDVTALNSNILNLGIIDSRLKMDCTDISEKGTANSYIVSEKGRYKIPAVKGNTTESVGEVAAAAVLWESFGTDTAPSVGNIVNDAVYDDGYVCFRATGKEGNALIAAKDASGNILWSWHIWVTDTPSDQAYNNNAGTMMDRNLGATSAAKGDVCSLGLLYQWGRKDPFLASATISGYDVAASTISWPEDVESDADCGTIEYATAHPTTFISRNSSNQDWYYTGSTDTDNTRWTASSDSKSMYDPCPAGYRIPDGGDSGLWATALGTGDNIQAKSGWDATNCGIDLGATDKTVGIGTFWYPAAGYLSPGSGKIFASGSQGYYWSGTPDGYYACIFSFSEVSIKPSFMQYRATGRSVRCCRDEDYIDPSSDLSAKETANSYIVTSAGTYRISAVKGNSSESVGEAVSAEVLWESFGKYSAPSVGDLVKDVRYSSGHIFFTATSNKGNAVIAVKDSQGNILWSWHIWLTSQPEDQTYVDQDGDEVGKMMDRNLGATTVNKGYVASLGLLYQWGRKDPFLGASDTNPGSIAHEAGSTIKWPSSVSSASTTGTIDYSVAHPTTFINWNSSNFDWYYSSKAERTRWQESSKTIYDPCPAGYKVPSGGEDGIWAASLGTADSWTTAANWDSKYCGIDFGATDITFGTGTYWYPAAGYIYGNTSQTSHSLSQVGMMGLYWSCTPKPYGSGSCTFRFYKDGTVTPGDSQYHCHALSVRCQKE